MSRPSIGSEPQPCRLTVTVESRISGETAQDHLRFASGFYCQARWGTDRNQCIESGNRRFLNQFKTGSSTDRANQSRGGESVASTEGSDQFVDGIVSANIFTHCDRDLFIVGPGSCRMNATGTFEQTLIDS